MSPPWSTNDIDLVKCLKSGKWVAKIQHPISKIWVFLGAYTTPEEASEAFARKKLEYESLSSSSSHPINNVTDFEKHPGVKITKSGKWRAKIKHNKESIWLGTYTTPKEAAEAFNMSKLELDSRKFVCSREESVGGKGKWKRCGMKGAEAQKFGFSEQRKRRVYKRSSGRWVSEIRNPITKAKVHLGTFDTADEAEEAYDNKRREFDLMICGHMTDICEVDATTQTQGKGNSNCVPYEPFVTTAESSVIKDGEGKENGGSMINVNVAETTGEFDLDVVDSYGQLVGEYSRMDDELWIC